MPSNMASSPPAACYVKSGWSTWPGHYLVIATLLPFGVPFHLETIHHPGPPGGVLIAGPMSALERLRLSRLTSENAKMCGRVPKKVPTHFPPADTVAAHQ